MTQEFLPCPFCGSPAEGYPGGDEEGFSIMCNGKTPFVLFGGTKANCPLNTFGYESREASIEAWNTRSNVEVRGASRLYGEASSGEAATSTAGLGTDLHGEQ